jgi:hypothetical protein
MGRQRNRSMRDDTLSAPKAPLPRGEAGALARRQRQALALRENLARRKAQARQRKTGENAAEAEPPADET